MLHTSTHARPRHWPAVRDSRRSHLPGGSVKLQEGKYAVATKEEALEVGAGFGEGWGALARLGKGGAAAGPPAHPCPPGAVLQASSIHVCAACR